MKNHISVPAEKSRSRATKYKNKRSTRDDMTVNNQPNPFEFSEADSQ
jgi:hypothetical protein